MTDDDVLRSNPPLGCGTMIYDQHYDPRCTPSLARNVSASVHALPAELLLYIFQLYMQQYRKYETQGYYRRLAELSNVCARWYKVVQSSRTLWTVISSTEPKSVITRALEKSSNLPLDVVFRFEQFTTPWNDLSGFVAYLQPHIGRSKTLDILSFGGSTEPIIDIVRHPMPLLEELKLVDPFVMWDTPVHLFQDKAPRLTEITLDGIVCHWDGDSFHGLNTLSLSWVSFPSLVTILNILSNSPQLRTLEIYRCKVDGSDPHSLPHSAALYLALLYLDLGSSQLVRDLTDHIRTGNRCSFRTHLPGQALGSLDDVARTIKNWIQRVEVNTLASGEGITINVSTEGVRVEFQFSDGSAPFSVQVDVMYPTAQIVPLLACFNNLLSPFKCRTTARLKLSRLIRLDASWKKLLLYELFKSPPITIVELGEEDDLDFWDALLTESARIRGDSVFAQMRTFSVPTTWKGAEIDVAVVTGIEATNDILQKWSVRGLGRAELRVSQIPGRKDTRTLSDWVKQLENIVGVGNAFIYIED